LNNYFIPYFENTVFLTKKGLDFLDFKIICEAVYKGKHKIEEIRSLVLKLSYTMNNFRLSTFAGSTVFLSKEEKNTIINATPQIEYLSDGRVKDISKNSIVASQISCVYEIKTINGEILIVDSLKEVLTIVGVSFRNLKKQLDKEGQPAEVNGYRIKRIAVFQ
jgi:hypothetical protein